MSESETRTLREKLTALPLAVYPLAVIVMTIGQFTGDYAGWYAQTDFALQLQTVFIVVMMVSPFIWYWGWDDAEERLEGPSNA